MTIKTYYVGGYVRDKLLGVRSNDIDLAVEIESFDAMRDWLVADSHEIFEEREQFGVIRARKGREVVDFVICREEGPYSDNRHPDWVKSGTIYTDLKRRDLTINAIAQDTETGEYIDPWGGRDDLKRRLLRAVGDPMERLIEDPLRAFRVMRFAVTKNFLIETELDFAIRNVKIINLMDSVSTDRIRAETHKMFVTDTESALGMLFMRYPMYLRIMTERGLWLRVTNEKRKK